MHPSSLRRVSMGQHRVSIGPAVDVGREADWLSARIVPTQGQHGSAQGQHRASSIGHASPLPHWYSVIRFHTMKQYCTVFIWETTSVGNGNDAVQESNKWPREQHQESNIKRATSREQPQESNIKWFKWFKWPRIVGQIINNILLK